MIELKITGANAAEVVAEMRGLLYGAWLNYQQAKQLTRGAVAIETAKRAAEKGADVETVPAPMKEEKAAEQDAPQEQEQTEAAADAPDIAEVRATLAAAMKRAGKEPTQALLKEYAPKLSRVKPEDYRELMTRAAALA